MNAESARSRSLCCAVLVLAAAVLGIITAPALADESVSEVVNFEVSSGPAIQVSDSSGPPEPVPWTTKYLIPTSVALAMVIVAVTSLQYYLVVVRKRYKVAE